MDRILIAGTHSGCGKTTVTAGLLWALKQRDITPRAFKCGPDYIDPMFHREAIGLPSGNLDAFFNGGAQLCARLSGGGLAVIEGVMGYYDGIGTHGECGTYRVAEATKTPVVLVVDARGQYTSAGAVIRGFMEFRPESNICGVIFNNASAMLYRGLSEIARDAGAEPIGFLPEDERVSVGSRHLGLITAAEIKDLQERLKTLGELAGDTVDIDRVLELAAEAPALQTLSAAEVKPLGNVRIAVARDEAFCFTYQENLELLAALGCAFAFFSPIHDTKLPGGIGGLYLPGGYPELHLAALSKNTSMLASVRGAVMDGLPTIAECGGFLYLHDYLDGVPLASVIHAGAYKTQKLKRFGYAVLRTNKDNLLCAAGEEVRVHEYHYYESESCGKGFLARKPGGGAQWDCVHATETLFAGFPHLYFPAKPEMAARFTRKAMEYAGKNL
jgi:cobyrinic acid a,c-diamide synthase